MRHYSKVIPLVFISLALAANARASEELFTAEYYQALCHPGSAEEKALSAADRKEMNEVRDTFLKFLDHPEPTIEAFRKGPLFNGSPDIGDNIEHLFTYAMTCQLAGGFESRIREGGCYDRHHRPHSAQKAARLCEPITAELDRQKKLEEEREKQPLGPDDKEKPGGDSGAAPVL